MGERKWKFIALQTIPKDPYSSKARIVHTLVFHSLVLYNISSKLGLQDTVCVCVMCYNSVCRGTQ